MLKLTGTNLRNDQIVKANAAKEIGNSTSHVPAKVDMTAIGRLRNNQAQTCAPAIDAQNKTIVPPILNGRSSHSRYQAQHSSARDGLQIRYNHSRCFMIRCLMLDESGHRFQRSLLSIGNSLNPYCVMRYPINMGYQSIKGVM
jgi:hypothetical protein